MVCGNGASAHTTFAFIGMLNYRESTATLLTVSAKRHPIQVQGDFPLTFQSSDALTLRDVAHVRSPSYHLLYLRLVADNGHTYTINQDYGITVKFKAS